MSRYAACLCTDRKMLVPALNAASAIKAFSRRGGNDLDVIVFMPAGEADPVAREWMAAHGILLDETFDTTPWAELVVNRRLHPATLLRLMLASHLAGRYDKLLYLDCDITVHGPVDAIFELDTGDAPLAACAANAMAGDAAAQAKAIEHLSAIGMTPPYRFFNAGVLLIDVAKWNAMTLGERVLAKIRTRPELFWLADEHGLNAVLNGNFAELSPIWNTRIAGWRTPQVRATVEPVLIHHDGPMKPWKRYGKGKRLFHPPIGYEHYVAFVRDTPWHGWLRKQWTLIDFLKSLREEWRQRKSRRLGAAAAPGAAGHETPAARVTPLVDASYEDVLQGIATREGGRLRLRAPKETA